MLNLIKFGKKLIKINRSITGSGNLKTLKLIQKKLPELKIKYFNSNSRVYDWKIPNEWNISEAFIKDKFGKKIIDFKNNNLHVVSYSTKVDKKLNKVSLLKKIFTNKTLKDAIPYVTSYYKKNWGFCLSENQKQTILLKYQTKDKFHVIINSKFKKRGKMYYGELFIPGKSKKEILISTYICHPGMANNELSGPLVSIALIKKYLKNKNKRSLRFLFLSETIGSIAYINQNFTNLKNNIIGGYVLSCIGDNREHSFVESKYGNSFSDICLKKAYKKLGIEFKKYSFLKRGSDERQFNSPIIDLGLATICRSKFGEYKEYHSSLDKFDSVVTKKGLMGGYMVAKEAINYLLNSNIQSNYRKISTRNPLTKIICEPQLSKRNLINGISNLSIGSKPNLMRKNLLNFLQYSDGTNSVSSIAKKIRLSFSKTKLVYKFCKKNDFIY